MTSGSDEYNKSTNPSSLNSSFDQLHQIRKPESQYANDMNFAPVQAPKPYAQYTIQNGNVNAQYPQQMHQVPTGPPPPPKHFAPNNPKQPIKLNGSSSGAPSDLADLSPSKSTKRQSWLKRKLSRKE